MRYGKWQAVRELGRGGQGTAYLAIDAEKLDVDKFAEEVRRTVGSLSAIAMAEDNRRNSLRLVELVETYLGRESGDSAGVVKVLHESIRREPNALARVEREIEVLRRLDHPNLIRVLEASPTDGWFVTPYYRAGPLSQHLNGFAGRPQAAIDAFRGLVDGVAAIHKLGAVHRDVKPENIFIGPAGLVLGDFGIVYVEDNAGTRVSDTYENVGSRDWMPGWTMGMRVDDVRPSFDVFGLGKLLWAMVSGRTKLRLWYFRRDEFNLERQFPGDERMPLINSLLDGAVREDEEEVWRSADELLANVDAISAILRRGGQLVRRDVPRVCQVCGAGIYGAVIDETSGPAGTRDFGLNAAGERFRIFACSNCGNVQWFRMTRNPPGWGELPR